MLFSSNDSAWAGNKKESMNSYENGINIVYLGHNTFFKVYIQRLKKTFFFFY